MIYQLIVPSAVLGVEEVRVLEWQGKPGATVEVGELIVELEIHKAVIEVRAGQAGVVRQILAQAGDWRSIGVPLALFSTDPNEDLPANTASIDALMVRFEVM